MSWERGPGLHSLKEPRFQGTASTTALPRVRTQQCEGGPGYLQGTGSWGQLTGSFLHHCVLPQELQLVALRAGKRFHQKRFKQLKEKEKEEERRTNKGEERRRRKKIKEQKSKKTKRKKLPTGEYGYFTDLHTAEGPRADFLGAMEPRLPEGTL